MILCKPRSSRRAFVARPFSVEVSRTGILLFRTLQRRSRSCFGCDRRRTLRLMRGLTPWFCLCCCSSWSSEDCSGFAWILWPWSGAESWRCGCWSSSLWVRWCLRVIRCACLLQWGLWSFLRSPFPSRWSGWRVIVRLLIAYGWSLAFRWLTFIVQLLYASSFLTNFTTLSPWQVPSSGSHSALKSLLSSSNLRSPPRTVHFICPSLSTPPWSSPHWLDTRWQSCPPFPSALRLPFRAALVSPPFFSFLRWRCCRYSCS